MELICRAMDPTTIVNPVSIVSRGPVLTKTWAIKPLAAGRLFVMIIRSLFVLIDGADPSSSQCWSALVSFQSATMFLWLWEYHTGRCNCIETHMLGFVLKTIYFHLINRHYAFKLQVNKEWRTKAFQFFQNGNILEWFICPKKKRIFSTAM